MSILNSQPVNQKLDSTSNVLNIDENFHNNLAKRYEMPLEQLYATLQSCH